MTDDQEVARAVLLRAAQYVEQGWCQGHYAEDEDGHPAPPDWERARSWCMSGAIMRADKDIYPSPAVHALILRATTLICSARRRTPQQTTMRVTWYNDLPGTTQHHAVSALKAAADLVVVAHRVDFSRTPYRWWEPILKEAESG